MILLTHDTPILLCVAPSDFRKGIDGFVAVCRLELSLDPRCGTVFMFINRARTMIRALTYDGTGYWIMTKRLSRGRFQSWPSGTCAISPASARELRLIMGGNRWSDEDGVNKVAHSARPSTTINPSSIQSTGIAAVAL